MIPLSSPDINNDDIKAVVDVLKSGWLTYGPKTQEFEQRFANYIGVKNAIAVNSGTSALFLAIKALGISGEVILPSFTFVASANAVMAAGAIPVFADIEYDTCNINPDSIEDKITSRTEAIMVVHYGGQSCEMDRIMKIVEKYGLALIEDSAETIGGEFKGEKTGSFGIGCFSFFPTKNITTGEGGMVTTNDDHLAEKIRAMVNHGMFLATKDREKMLRPWYREASIVGYNFRMSDILGALGLEQLKRIDILNENRRKHAEFLNKNLEGIEEIEIPVEKAYSKHVYQMYTVKIKPSINRDQFVLTLRKKGIGASVHFDPPVHMQPPFKEKYDSTNLSVTEIVSSRIVTLPMYPGLTNERLEAVVRAVKQTIFELKSESG